uniref:Uncharacterized protein n=1 Tax=Cynoglossus semilaevis TaxID=244447 RepID=A0A3P8VXF9_CYNSE
MASAVKCFGVSLFLLSLHGGAGVSGRAVAALGFPRRTGSEKPSTLEPLSRSERRRWRRDSTEDTRRDRCAELGAAWMENARHAEEEEDTAMVLRLRGRLFSPADASRVYQCCQGGGVCSSVKGIQGHVEFLLSGDVLSLAVTRAELHLQIFNPLHLDVRPVLPSRAEDGLPTRYSLWSEGTRAELRVDLLFLLRGLQGAAGGTGAGGGHSVVNMRRMAFIQKPASLALQEARGQTRGGGVLTKLPDLELGLVLSCSRGGAAVSCGSGSVQLSHTPFVALYYR